MSRDESVYLEHMLEMARKAHDKIRDLRREEYDADENLRIALVHLIQVIGEAARHVPPEVQRAAPGIPRPDIVGMRHRIVHDYMDVNDDVVWAVATRDLPSLIEELHRITPPQAESDRETPVEGCG